MKWEKAEEKDEEETIGSKTTTPDRWLGGGATFH